MLIDLGWYSPDKSNNDVVTIKVVDSIATWGLVVHVPYVCCTTGQWTVIEHVRVIEQVLDWLE